MLVLPIEVVLSKERAGLGVSCKLASICGSSSRSQQMAIFRIEIIISSRYNLLAESKLRQDTRLIRPIRQLA